VPGPRRHQRWMASFLPEHLAALLAPELGTRSPVTLGHDRSTRDRGTGAHGLGSTDGLLRAFLSCPTTSTPRWIAPRARWGSKCARPFSIRRWSSSRAACRPTSACAGERRSTFSSGPCAAACPTTFWIARSRASPCPWRAGCARIWRPRCATSWRRTNCAARASSIPRSSRAGQRSPVGAARPAQGTLDLVHVRALARALGICAVIGRVIGR
jgi:hypothetical protein